MKVVLTKPGLSPRELAEDLSLSRSTVTRFLDSLEKKGFVRRESVGKDGREIQVYPTAKAEDIRDQLNETRVELMERISTLLGENEMPKTVATLRQTRSALEKK